MIASRLPWRVDAWEELRPQERAYCASVENVRTIQQPALLERATFQDLCIALVERRFADFRPHYRRWMTGAMQQDRQVAALLGRPDPYSTSKEKPARRWQSKSAKSSHHRR